MTFDEALRDIESLDFAARVNIASDLRTFLRVAGDQESVRTVANEIVSEEKQQRLLFEALRLSRMQVDFRYENPWDSALAVFLWLLSSKVPPLARVAAEAVVQARQCWWALRMAHGILRESLLRSTEVSEREHVVRFVRPVHSESTSVGERILWMSLLGSLRFPFDVLFHADIATEPLEEDPRIVAWQADVPGYAFNLTSQSWDTPLHERGAS